MTVQKWRWLVDLERLPMLVHLGSWLLVTSAKTLGILLVQQIVVTVTFALGNSLRGGISPQGLERRGKIEY